MLERHGIKGGETRVFESNGPQGQRFTLQKPFSLLLLDDLGYEGWVGCEYKELHQANFLKAWLVAFTQDAWLKTQEGYSEDNERLEPYLAILIFLTCY